MLNIGLDWMALPCHVGIIIINESIVYTILSILMNVNGNERHACNICVFLELERETHQIQLVRCWNAVSGIVVEEIDGEFGE